MEAFVHFTYRSFSPPLIRMLFVKVIIPSVPPVWTKQPKTNPARSSIPGQFGSWGWRRWWRAAGVWFCRLRTRRPPVSRLGRCSGAATGVLQVRFHPGGLRKNEPLSHTGWNNLLLVESSPPKAGRRWLAYYCCEKALESWIFIREMEGAPKSHRTDGQLMYQDTEW